MSTQLLSRILLMACAIAALLWPSALPADLVAVRYQEGLLHGFLLLRSDDGVVIAVGDWTQFVKGDRVTSNLVFHFKDGSLHQETTVFSQRGKFQLLNYHSVQKGPAFKHPSETWLNAATGQFTAHYQEDGKDKNLSENVQCPADVANGMVPTLIENLPPGVEQATFSFVASTPKPRVVKLAIVYDGEDSFSVGGSSRKAKHYIVKVELGGVAGVVAPLVHKQPTDTHVWIQGGESPVLIRSQGALYEGGPIWTIELTGPTWPEKAPETNSTK
jgi:hypothetical protein